MLELADGDNQTNGSRSRQIKYLTPEIYGQIAGEVTSW